MKRQDPLFKNQGFQNGDIRILNKQGALLCEWPCKPTLIPQWASPEPRRQMTENKWRHETRTSHMILGWSLWCRNIEIGWRQELVPRASGGFICILCITQWRVLLARWVTLKRFAKQQFYCPWINSRSFHWGFMWSVLPVFYAFSLVTF